MKISHTILLDNAYKLEVDVFTSDVRSHAAISADPEALKAISEALGDLNRTLSKKLAPTLNA